MKQLPGQVVLITGAARGQGRSHAIRAARAGADVVAIDVCEPDPQAVHEIGSRAELEETADLVRAEGRQALAVVADVADFDAMEKATAAAIERFGRLDAVIPNAAVFAMARSWEFSEAQWRRAIDVILTGGWNTARAAVPHLIESGGSITFIGSTAAGKGLPGMGAYVAAKHGLVGIMRTMAVELGQYGVRVNMVSPSSTNTTMLKNEAVIDAFTAGTNRAADFEAACLNTHALPLPWLEPDDISDAVLFLASDRARAITGVVLPVDAGFLIK